jgi:hypothetical protein
VVTATTSFWVNAGAQATVDLGEGNDRFTVASSGTGTVDAGDGNDRGKLAATNAAGSRIAGGLGDDTLGVGRRLRGYFVADQSAVRRRVPRIGSVEVRVRRGQTTTVRARMSARERSGLGSRRSLKATLAVELMSPARSPSRTQLLAANPPLKAHRASGDASRDSKIAPSRAAPKARSPRGPVLSTTIVPAAADSALSRLPALVEQFAIAAPNMMRPRARQAMLSIGALIPEGERLWTMCQALRKDTVSQKVVLVLTDRRLLVVDEKSGVVVDDITPRPDA